ncbi:MAG: YfhO family protein [Lachnospiraceae bacterium]|nr:YfhO family protein [Lachnospiraceae bacterium]
MNKRKTLLCCFLLPVVIMLTIFIIRGIYPFGDRSFLYMDMYHQYMPFFSEFLNKIKAGEGLAYSYHVGIGSNFLALYVYYLASPLHWLAFLVPEAFLMEFMSYLVIAKIGLCGLTAAYYLQKRFGDGDFAVLFFACFYALSGFMAAYNWNIMWLDCVILLPLVVLGLERLVKEGKCGLYCVTLALSIFTNYYISIMVCIFLVLYFCVLFVTEKRSIRIVGNFALYSLLAGGMAAILLIPEVCAIMVTDFGDMDFPTKLESYFSVLDMLTRHCMCVTTHKGLDHWPNIYSGVAVFLLIPMYVLNQSISIRKRFANMALAGFLLLAFSTNMLDFIWHGMNYPDSLPARQSFIYIFLLLIMCYEAYRNVGKTSEKYILYSYLGTVVFLLFCEKFVESDDFEIGTEMLTLVFVSAYAVLLYLYRTKPLREQYTKIVLAVVTLVVVVAECSINTSWTSVGTVSRSDYLGQQADYQALYDYTKELEKEGNGNTIYRLEKFTRKTKNDATLTGYPSASVFSSTMNSAVMDMYKRLGMRHSKVYYGFDGATAFTGALLNVNYMFGESEKYENSLYRLLEKSGDIYLYESTQTLPFGYVAPTGFDLPEGDSSNGIRIQNLLMKDLGLAGNLLEKVSAKASGDDVKFTAKENGIYYAYLTAGGTSKVEAIGGMLEEQSFNDLKHESILYLGQLYEGESITLKNGDKEDVTQKISADIYQLNEEILQQALAKLSAQHLTEVNYSSTAVSGKLALTEAGRLILSIPYETGWKVLVNGEEVEPQLFGGTLMAFDLEPGEYMLEMHYVPTGKWAGVAVSVVSVMLFGGLMLIEKKRRRL